MANEDRLQALLEQLTEMEQMESREELDGLSQLAKEILSLDPLNPRAKLALWASLEEEEAAKSLHLLEEALDAVRPLVNEGTPGMPEDDINAETYGASLECLSVFNYNLENYEKALAFAKELVAFDDEGLYEGRIPLYCALLKLEKHTDILSALDADPLETLVGEYARAFAHHGMGEEEDALESLLQAISMAPDLPFFILGIWGIPEEDEDIDEEMEDLLHQAMALSEPCLSSPANVAFMCQPVYMLGYLTDRISDPEELELLEKDFEQRDIADQMQEAKDRIFEMIDKEQTQEEIDEEALQAVHAILQGEKE